MQRADKIGLIVASILVVVLSAGAGLLLYKRSTTLAAERPLDTSVKLVALEDTASAEVATVTPANSAPKPTVPSRPAGSDFGFITRISGSGNDLALRWDQAELLTGSDADLYAKKNGAVINTRLYYLANDTHTTKVYDISPKVIVEVAASDGTTSTLTAAQFAKRWNAGGEIRTRPWFLSLRSGDVVRLVQVVLPPPDTPLQ